MPEQLPLELVQPVRYAACNFVLHSGIREQVREAETMLARPTSSLVYFELAPRSGKTHLSIYLGETLANAGKSVIAVEGISTKQWFEEILAGVELGANSIVVVDDADLFFTQVSQLALTGLVVDVLERLQRGGVGLLFLCAAPIESFRLEPHITSRLRAALVFHAAPPTDEDLDTLLDSITKQRGLLLTESKRSYMLKRVARSIPGLVEAAERLGEGTETNSTSTSFHAISEIVRS